VKTDPLFRAANRRVLVPFTKWSIKFLCEILISADTRMHLSRYKAISFTKRQIGDHALPQRDFGLGTPEGAEGGWATPGNTGRGRQRERAQAAVHQTSSKHTFTSKHGRISNRRSNQKDTAGKHRAHSNRNRAATSGQEAHLSAIQWSHKLLQSTRARIGNRMNCKDGTPYNRVTSSFKDF
jgi:hypothetical protein